MLADLSSFSMINPQVMTLSAKLAVLPIAGVAIMTLVYAVGMARALPWTLLLWALTLQSWLWLTMSDHTILVLEEVGLYLPGAEKKSIVAAVSLGISLAFWSLLATAKGVAVSLLWAARGSKTDPNMKPQVANLQAIMRTRGAQSPKSARYVALLNAASNGNVREIGPISRTN